MTDQSQESSNFILDAVREDLESGRFNYVRTRFPPEPNGYLHIGHAKAICIDFETAQAFGGTTNLRFDDTNPVKEDVEYVEAIKEDIRWLGFDWGDREFYASDYFEQLYEFAVQLIKKGKAYVCHLSPEEIREYRGTLTEPGRESPYRNRTVEENLELFERMRMENFQREHVYCVPKLTWLPAISTCAIRSCIELSIRRHTIVPGISGVSTPCMISPTDSAIRSRGLPILCVIWLTRIIGRCMNGLSVSWAFFPAVRLSLPALTSLTPS